MRYFIRFLFVFNLYFIVSFFSYIIAAVSFSKDTEIQSDSAVLSEKDQVIIFTCNVRVNSKNGELQSDKIEITHSNKFAKIAKIKITGNIKCKFKNYFISSENAIIQNDIVNFFVEKFHLKNKNFSFFKTNDLKILSKNFEILTHKNKIKTLTASKNVCILYNGSIITADFGTFDWGKNLVILKNNVKILDNKNNFIKCEKCEIDLSKKNYKIIGQINGQISL